MRPAASSNARPCALAASAASLTARSVMDFTSALAVSVVRFLRPTMSPIEGAHI